MKKRLAVIMTGGTIGSKEGDEEFSLCDDNSLLSSLIKDIALEIGVSVDIRSPLNKLSENFLPADWVRTLEAIDRAIADGHTAVVVTHGTDTLHFTANYVRQFLTDTNARVCFTGAFNTPDIPDSDAPRNIRAALQDATSEGAAAGVFAVFGLFQLEAAPSAIDVSEVMPMLFDQQLFRRCFGAQLADDSRKFESSTSISNIVDYDIGVERPDVVAMNTGADKVAFANSYPGSPMSLWKHHAEDGVIVIEAYHGGTGFVDASRDNWATLKESRPDLTICLASIPEHYLKRPYETTRHLAGAGVIVLKNIPPHVAYVCAVTRSVAGVAGSDIFAPLHRYRFI